ncbi:MAG TPA: NosD domain-containing protein, partial [Puia sp.]|nr:NosD domain-containing protein [Puia sp.]
MKTLFIYGLILCYSIPPASAKTIIVGPNERIRTITQGIAAASNGDTVNVRAGHYFEHGLVVNKSILLKGFDFPTVDGENKYEVISITASHVTIEGFTVINSGSSSVEDFAGIKIINTRDVIVRNNILHGNIFGIYTQYGTNCRIENNKISSHAVSELLSGNGIHCWKSDSMYILENVVNGNRDGIYFEFVTHSVIWNNQSYNNIRYGLHFMFSNDDEYVNNIFSANGSGVA